MKECRYKKKCKLGKGCDISDDKAWNYCGEWKNIRYGPVNHEEEVK